MTEHEWIAWLITNWSISLCAPWKLFKLLIMEVPRKSMPFLTWDMINLFQLCHQFSVTARSATAKVLERLLSPFRALSLVLVCLFFIQFFLGRALLLLDFCQLLAVSRSPLEMRRNAEKNQIEWLSWCMRPDFEINRAKSEWKQIDISTVKWDNEIHVDAEVFVDLNHYSNCQLSTTIIRISMDFHKTSLHHPETPNGSSLLGQLIYSLLLDFCLGRQ